MSRRGKRRKRKGKGREDKGREGRREKERKRGKVPYKSPSMPMYNRWESGVKDTKEKKE